MRILKFEKKIKYGLRKATQNYSLDWIIKKLNKDSNPFIEHFY